MVGATKRYGLTAAESLAECGRGAHDDPACFGAAGADLQRRAAQVWPPAERWVSPCSSMILIRLPLASRDGIGSGMAACSVAERKLNYTYPAARADEDESESEQLSP